MHHIKQVFNKSSTEKYVAFSIGWARILLQGWELSITSGLNPGVLL